MAFKASKLSALGAVSGVLAVIMGAFGAHGLESLLKSGEITQRQFEAYGTGADYHLLHAVLLVVIGILPARKLRTASAIAFIIGMALFSGGLYTYGVSGARAAAMITPIGGVGYTIGWALLAIMFWKPLK